MQASINIGFFALTVLSLSEADLPLAQARAGSRRRGCTCCRRPLERHRPQLGRHELGYHARERDRLSCWSGSAHHLLALGSHVMAVRQAKNRARGPQSSATELVHTLQPPDWARARTTPLCSSADELAKQSPILPRASGQHQDDSELLTQSARCSPKGWSPSHPAWPAAVQHAS